LTAITKLHKGAEYLSLNSSDPNMEIKVTATPNAKFPAVVKINESNYKVKVNARAAEGKANARLVEILAEYFNVSKSHIRILKGANSRNKVVEIRMD